MHACKRLLHQGRCECIRTAVNTPVATACRACQQWRRTAPSDRRARQPPARGLRACVQQAGSREREQRQGAAGSSREQQQQMHVCSDEPTARLFKNNVAGQTTPQQQSMHNASTQCKPAARRAAVGHLQTHPQMPGQRDRGTARARRPRPPPATASAPTPTRPRLRIGVMRETCWLLWQLLDAAMAGACNAACAGLGHCTLQQVHRRMHTDAPAGLSRLLPPTTAAAAEF